MARLIYSAIASLDGYTVDSDGRFDWCAPDEEVHAAVNEQERSVGTYLYGRRMYDVMQVWQTWDTSDEPAVVQDFAELWRAADKVVYSRTLTEPATPRTRIERELDPGAVRRLADEADRDVSIAGPTVAAAVIRAGIVDEVHLYLAPVVVGGGTRALPDGARLDLELGDVRRFESGFVRLSYRR
ncbi:dihydrofolate reductase family protein [Nocardioides sp. CN2-186]|uniref:dihydrofolate reductase family protein n=1 Tax=Nocardioides tweenelious TaxID=3156607 RepID=UPI0032B575ED